MTKEDFTELMRQSVLESFDLALLEHANMLKAGWLDQDLPALFEGIQPHIDELWKRHKDKMKG